MHIFVYEYLSSGAEGSAAFDSAMSREGWAMIRVALEDFARLPEAKVVTVLRPELGKLAPPSVHVRTASTSEQERSLFVECAAAADATFVIAPEAGGVLSARRSMADRAGGRFLGHAPGAIELCSDKLRLCEHLQARGIATVPTASLDSLGENPPFGFPIVVKPRDGAGSADVRRIADRGELEAWRRSASHDTTWIVQPFLAGTPLSVSAIAYSTAGIVEVFPAGEQVLSADGRFHYLGGRIPARRPTNRAQELVAEACRSMDGLAGYIGFDLIAPPGTEEPIIVEANPRLTTSYVGYRALAQENLAERILDPSANRAPIRWSDDVVEFHAAGEISVTRAKEAARR